MSKISGENCPSVRSARACPSRTPCQKPAAVTSCPAGDRPPPYAGGEKFGENRSARACPSRTPCRKPAAVTSCTAGDRPPPYAGGEKFGENCSARACPSRSPCHNRPPLRRARRGTGPRPTYEAKTSAKTGARGPVPRVFPGATVRRCVVHSGGQAPALRMRGKLRRKP